MQEEQTDQQPNSQMESPEAQHSSESGEVKRIPIGGSRLQRFRRWYVEHKKWTIPASVLMLLLILAVVPWSRYQAAGLVVKKDFNIQILDSTSHSPVSEATVKAGSVSAQTDGNGRVKLRLSAGRHAIVITKKYYKDQRASVLVPILDQKTTPAVDIDATGRQVKIVVKNLISQKTLENVDIKVADIIAKTDKNGEAIVVLPAGALEQKTNLSLKGYNNSEVVVKISIEEVLENNFDLTPTGKVYFLSKRTGKLDLMKADLDGSNPQVVLAGTGREKEHNTVVLASPSQKYIALIARRSSAYATPQLHILSTEDDKLLGVDNTNAEFSIVGWSGENLIYTVSRTDLPDWQPGIYKLKSYDAGTGKITLLNQSSAAGDANDSAYEYYEFILIFGDKIAYGKNWYSSTYAGSEGELLSGKQHTLAVINANGLDSKPLATYKAEDIVAFAQHKPSAFYIQDQTPDDQKKFYEYIFGLAAPKSVSIDEESFYDSYQIFYISPSGKKSLWTENRDGKYTVFVGDERGLNVKTVRSLGEYDVYDWYTDEYILLIKDDSELYIMSAEGSEPVKITDFQPTSYKGF